jgi:CubicO group peptidase (beta-lactamase class C family)
MADARREMFKLTPCDGPFVEIPYREAFTADEFAKLRAGLVPEAMEDKWLAFFEEPFLYLHRSWTGDLQYRIRFDQASGAAATECVMPKGALGPDDPAYQATLLSFLVRALILGQDVPFPQPPGGPVGPPGVLQHALSGTGRPEVPFRPSRLQRLWRWLSGAGSMVVLLAAAAVHPAQSPPPPADSELTTAPPADVGFSPTTASTLRASVAAGNYPRTTSVLVVKDRRLVIEEYFEPGGREVLNDPRSAMKSVTSLAVGAALADGRLRSVTEPAFARLGDLGPFANDGALKQAITIEDLLTMSSALDCNDWDDASVGNEENMYPRERWVRWAVDLPTKLQYARDAAGRGPFSYCTAGTLLLGQIVQRATGEPVDRYVERRLLQPLGIRRAEWPRSPTGEVMTGGGLRLRSRDLAKLGLLVLSRGRWQRTRILPEEWLGQALAPHGRVDAEQEYGYLFWRRDYRTPSGPVSGWYMSGNGGNVVVAVPQRNLVVVVTRVHYNSRGMHQQTAALVEEVLAGLGSGPAAVR